MMKLFNHSDSTSSKAKIIVSLLLLIAIFPVLVSLAPNATGQSMTTVSTIQISTASQTVDGTSGGKYCFIFGSFSFTAQKNQQITAAIDSSSKIDFSVITDADYNTWGNNKYPCNLSGISPLVNQTGITHYDLSLMIPSDGAYRYFFINRSPDTPATVTFTYPSMVTVSLAVTGAQGFGGDTTLIAVVVAAVVAVVLAFYVGTRRGRAIPPPPPGY